MKGRDWTIVVIGIIFLVTISSNVGGEDEVSPSWDSFQTVWTEISYENITTIWIRHPVNGSLVAEGQKLNFVVVPFDADELLYTVDVYKDGIHMYRCNQEKVYDLDIYTINPIDSVVTIYFSLNAREVLKLKYYAVLLTPSLDRDFTDQWLAYRAEVENETMTGRELINRRDQSLREFGLVASTGMWSLLLAGLAVFLVLLFQIIKVVNLFSAIVWFGSALIWLDSMGKIDVWFRSLTHVTASDAFVYGMNIATVTLIIVIANLFYLLTYKATSTRLRRKEFDAIDKEGRVIRRYDAVIGQSKNKIFWRLQDSFSAIRRVFFRADYEIMYDRGNIEDNYRQLRTKVVPENIDVRKDMKLLNRIAKRIAGKMAFYARDNDTGEIIKTKHKVAKYDYDVWKVTETHGPLSAATPLLVLDGEPDFRREYDEGTYDNVLDEMKAVVRESSDPEFIKKLGEKIKGLEKGMKKPKRYVVNIKPSNKDVYSLEDWLTDCKTFDNQADLINKLKGKIHEKERELIGKAYEAGEEIYTSFDKAYEDWEKGALKEVKE